MSSSRFPPVAKDEHQINELLEVYRSVLPPGREAWYVSSPITTGGRLRELQSLGAGEAPRDQERLIAEHVIEPNRRQAQEYVQRLRNEHARYVIDPTAVNDIEGWGQDDFRYFWGRVIETFVRCVVFRHGWEQSSGCSYEFLVATRAGVETLDEGRVPLSRDQGVSLLIQVVDAESEGGTNAEFLQAVLKSLEALGAGSVS